MGQKQVAALLAAGLLLLGTLVPIFRSPLKGTVTYFQFAGGEASIVVACAGLGLVLALMRRFEWLWLPGVAALGTVGFALIKFWMITSGKGTRFAEQFFDSPFDGINRLVQQTFALEWGWAPLLAGAVLMAAAGRMQGTTPRGGRR